MKFEADTSPHSLMFYYMLIINIFTNYFLCIYTTYCRRTGMCPAEFKQSKMTKMLMNVVLDLETLTVIGKMITKIRTAVAEAKICVDIS